MTCLMAVLLEKRAQNPLVNKVTSMPLDFGKDKVLEGHGEHHFWMYLELERRCGSFFANLVLQGHF